MQLVYYSTENWDRFETANTIAQWLQTYQSYTIQPCETVGLVLKGIKQLWSKKYGWVKPSTLFTKLVKNISTEKLIIEEKTQPEKNLALIKASKNGHLEIV